MIRAIFWLGVGAALMAAFGCASTPRVQVPPHMNLEGYRTVGMLEFSSNADGDLPRYASQRFLGALQASQSVAVLELGTERAVLERLGKTRLDAEAVRAIGEAHGVDALISGEFEVTKVRPSLRVARGLEAVTFDADVDATLQAKLYETQSGATRWTDSAQASATVAHASVAQGGRTRFDAGDPERAYGSLVQGLVNQVTRDFRPSWRRAQ